jgi:translation initiation factor 2 gamma subunit (eIF-2gamma)
MGDTPSAWTQPPLTLGTAGHIDHGKTALIESLTGMNTDRLPEERSRGISIELGYARLELPSGRPCRSSTSRVTSGSFARWWPAPPASTRS